MTSLELAVRFGKTLIIQEMDGVEPVLYPLLRKDLIAQGVYSHTHMPTNTNTHIHHYTQYKWRKIIDC